MIETALLSVISIWLNGCSSKVSSAKFIKNTNQQDQQIDQQIDEIQIKIKKIKKDIEDKEKEAEDEGEFGEDKGIELKLWHPTEYDIPEELQFKYYGEVKNSKPDGFGKAIYEEEEMREIYIGEWKNGKYNGKGIKKIYDFETRKEFYTYIGNFKNGKYHGVGKKFRSFDVSWNRVVIYQGYWEDGFYKGLGTLLTSDGKKKIYEGNYSIIKPDVESENWWLSEDVVISRRNGFGTSFHENGKKKYVGYWKGDLYHGFGILFDENGKKLYEGEWLDEKKNGIFIYYDDNGEILYKQKWKNGQKASEKEF